MFSILKTETSYPADIAFQACPKHARWALHSCGPSNYIDTHLLCISLHTPPASATAGAREECGILEESCAEWGNFAGDGLAV